MHSLRPLPKECGLALICAGIIGLTMAGPIDLVFVTAGVLVLWPAAFRRVELCLQARLPSTHLQFRKHVDMFLDHYERRFSQASSR